MACKNDLRKCEMRFGVGNSAKSLEFNYLPNSGEEARRVKYSASAEMDGGSEILYEAKGTAEIFQPNELFSPYQTLNKETQTYSHTILTQPSTLTIETMAMSEIGNIRNEFNKTHFAQLQDYYKVFPKEVDGS
jgi:hypothetical protein